MGLEEARTLEIIGGRGGKDSQLQWEKNMRKEF